jgi:hypothetical protein
MSSEQQKNSERMLIRIIREICTELSIKMTTSFTDWIVRIEADNGRRAMVFGYDFGLNSSSAAQIAGDKAATAACLGSNGVDCVPHYLVFRPDFSHFSDDSSTYGRARDLFDQLGNDAVCKNNRGTGGAHVYRTRTIAEVEIALQRVFAVHYAAAISPYVESTAEYRVIMIDGCPTAAFSKVRPSVKGDGQRTLAELIATTYPEKLVDSKSLESLPSMKAVPTLDELVVLNWRHNLGQGAVPTFIDDGVLMNRLCDIARRSLLALGLRCGSVDILQVGERLPVLEVNNGIMMESLARSGAVGSQLAHATYSLLIRKVLCLGDGS